MVEQNYDAILNKKYEINFTISNNTNALSSLNLNFEIDSDNQKFQNRLVCYLTDQLNAEIDHFEILRPQMQKKLRLHIKILEIGKFSLLMQKNSKILHKFNFQCHQPEIKLVDCFFESFEYLREHDVWSLINTGNISSFDISLGPLIVDNSPKKMKLVFRNASKIGFC